MTDDVSSKLRRAASALVALRKERDALQKARTEPIAIVGTGCRLPGGANDLESFARLLEAKTDAVGPIPNDRFDADAIYDAERGRAGKSYVKEGGFLASVDGFDAPFFGISPREAALIDPQHRLLAECAWEALEDAGIPPARLRGEHVGVYVGIGPSDYARAIAGADEAYALTGTGASFSAGRIAFLLGLHGPAVAVDTACSSSLVALHLACKALRSGECDVALAGGVQVMLGPELFVLLSRFRALAPDGRCKAFSDRADGYGRGEGCGVLALKRLSDADRDGDKVLGIIRGTAINHDGSSSGLTTPNGSAQRDVIERALADAGLAPADVDHVEAHGTGTSLGDPIEVEALAAAYGPGRDAPLAISTAKSYIGHLESASGVAGVLKVLASLDREVLPASLHTERLNPEVPWESLPIRVLREAEPWPRSARPRRAGVSSFGMSGTNAHVLLEEAPPREAPAAKEASTASSDRPHEIVLLSARSEAALDAQSERLAAHMESHADLTLGDVAFTLATARETMPNRRAFVVGDRAALVDALRSSRSSSSTSNAPSKPAGRVAWVFSGQGAQVSGMGRALHAAWPAFRDAFDACIAQFGEELRDVMWSEADPRLDQTGFAQPALFTFEYALATLLRSWGLTPDVLLGHSLGEIVAATIAGVFSLEDATKLVAARGRLMQALPAGGAMVAIEASEADVRAALGASANGSPGDGVSIAAVNGPSSTVISGREGDVAVIASTFAARGARTKRLTVSHAFHSVLMEPMLDAFRAVAAAITYDMPTIPLVSNVSGRRIGLEIASADYWVRHVREAVRFADGVTSAAADTFVEIGPRAVLLGTVGSAVADASLVPAVRGPHDETRGVLDAVAKLFVAGAAIDPRGLFPRAGGTNGGRRVALPKYAWQHARCWANVPAPARAEGRRGRWPLSGVRQKTPGGIVHHTLRIGVRHQPYLGDHRVFGHVVVAGAFQIGTVLAVAQETWPGETVALADVEFLRALTLESDELELELHAILTPDGSGGYTFEIASTPLDAETWTAHARGRIERGGEACLRPVAELAIDASTRLDADAFYAQMDATELAWGPAWRWTTGGRTGERVAVSDIALRLPDDGPMHPVLLDNAFGMGVYTQATPQAEGERPLPFVPFTMQRIRVLRAPEGDVRCGAVRRHAEGSAADVCVVDLVFEDARGTFAEIEAFAARRARENALVNGVLAARNATAESDVTYRVAFEVKPLGPASNVPASSAPAKAHGRPWILVAKPGCAIAAAIAKARPTILAEPEAIASASAEAAGVVYVFGEEPGDVPDRAAARSVEALALVKRLSAMPTPPARLVWVTSAAVDVGGEDVDPSASVIWGLGRTVLRERPELGLELADVDAASTAAFAAALDTADGEPETAWRNEIRHVARLARVTLAASEHAPKTLRTDGTALVTGGLGALGLHVAHALAARGFRRLVLTGRRGFGTPGAAEAIDALTARGVVVTVAAIDVADRVALDGVLATIPTDAPLRAVFHTAGVLDDGVLDEQDAARFARVFAPKIDGTWNLHEATRGLDLDAFVLFSSAVSVFGSPGQAGYTAANAFLDGFASHRRAHGLPAQSLGWGAWGGSGMAARLDDAGRTRMTRLGFGTFTPEQAIAALDRALAIDGQSAPHLVLAALDLPTLAVHAGRFLDGLVATNVAATGGAGTKADAAPLRDRFAELSEPERERIVVALVREETAAALRLASAAAVPLDVPLQRMGLDSLTALEIRNRLQARSGESLPATMLFEHPTPGAVAAELVARLVARLARKLAPTKTAPQTFVDFEL